MASEYLEKRAEEARRLNAAKQNTSFVNSKTGTNSSAPTSSYLEERANQAKALRQLGVADTHIGKGTGVDTGLRFAGFKSNPAPTVAAPTLPEFTSSADRKKRMDELKKQIALFDTELSTEGSGIFIGADALNKVREVRSKRDAAAKELDTLRKEDYRIKSDAYNAKRTDYMTNIEKASDADDFRSTVDRVQAVEHTKASPVLQQAIRYLTKPESIQIDNTLKSHLDNLTKSQKDNFLYQIGKKNYADAEKYLEYLEQDTNEIKASEQEKKLTDFVEKNGKTGYTAGMAGSIAASVLGAPGAVVEASARAAKNLAAEKLGVGEWAPADVNADAYAGARAASTLQQATAQKAYDAVLAKTNNKTLAGAASFVNSTFLSIAQNLTTVAVSSAAGPAAPAVSLALMSVSAGGQTVTESLKNGDTLNQAFVKGISATAIEALTEKMPLDEWFKTAHANPRELKKMLKNVAKQAAIEGAEETFSEVANTAVDLIVSGEDAEMIQLKRKLLAAGYSEKEANRMVVKEFGKRVGLAALGGALSGGVMGSAAAGVSVMRADLVGKQLRAEHTEVDLIASALAQGDKTTQSFKMAQELEERIEKNGKNAEISDMDLGCLYVQMGIDAAVKVEAEEAEAKKTKAVPKQKSQLVELAQTGTEEEATYATAQLAHTEETVVSPIAQELMDAGLKPAEATEQAALILKVKSGTTIPNKEADALKLDNPIIRSAFTAATGVAVSDADARKSSSARKIIQKTAAEVAAQKKTAEEVVIQMQDAEVPAGETSPEAQAVAASVLSDAVTAEEQARGQVSSETPVQQATDADLFAEMRELNKHNPGAMDLYQNRSATTGAASANGENRASIDAGQNGDAEVTTGKAATVARTLGIDTVETKNISQRLTLRVLKDLGEEYGVEVELGTGMGEENGSYMDGVVLINAEKATNQFLMTYYFAHEITHRGRDMTKGALVNEILDVMEAIEGSDAVKDGVAERLGTYRAFLERKKKDPNEFKEANAREELACDFIMRAIKNRSLLDRLAGVQPSTIKQMMSRLRDLMQRVTKRGGKTRELERLMDRLRTSLINGTTGATEGSGDAGKRHSIDTMVEPLGLTYEKTDKGVTIFRDADGNAVENVTEEMVRDSALGAVIELGVKAGTITESDMQKQVQFFADLYNLMLETQDIDMIWAVSSAIGFEPVVPGPRDVQQMDSRDSNDPFAPYTKNSDPQYSTTVDFTTICLKTKAIIDVMSETMVRLKSGLSEDEIVNIVYKNVYEGGQPVPCPVCYVFSRWVGLGGLFDTMWENQKKYADLDAAKDDIARLEKDIEEVIAKYTGKKKLTNTDAKDKVYKPLNKRKKALETKQALYDSGKSDTPLTVAEQNELKAITADVQILDNWSWLHNVRMQDGYKPVPAEILFDINRGKDFAEQYPKAWKFRTTRGPAMGKAATPYAAEHLGQFIRGASVSLGSDTKLGDQSKNPFNQKTENGQLSKEAVSAWEKARNRVRSQNLLNGQRYQSTSDFRFEYVLDYLLTFVEAQAIGSKVQLYTKVPESVRMFAAVNAEVNLSLMPLGVGYDENDNLIFSSVTGMNAEDAFALSAEFDNVQPIMVGTSVKHIQLCMADDRITFIIPYHASGASEGRYKNLMGIVGESVKDRDDFSAYQTDNKKKKATAMQKAAYDLRLRILTGDGKKTLNLTIADKALLGSNPKLRDLYNRFWVEGYDPECYGVRLTSDQAKSIFPFEYWDKTSTIETADAQGRAFCDYCEMLGLHPRFSGWDSKGKYNEKFDFSKDSGYWKMLIDRSMYNRDGSYHEQKAIDVTSFTKDFLFRDEAVKGLVQPSQLNDPDSVSKITDKTIADIEEKRYSLSAQDSENQISELRLELEDLDDQIEFADLDGLGAEDIRKLRNQRVKVQAELDKRIAAERKASVLTSRQEILDNLYRYRRSDLESLAEQVSNNAWDDYAELSDEELIDALREILDNGDLTPLELQQKKYGFYVKPPAVGNKKAAQMDGENVRYSLADKSIPTYEELIAKPDMQVVDISTPVTTGSFTDRRRAMKSTIKEVIKRPYLNKDTGVYIFLTERSYYHSFSNSGAVQLNAAEHYPELVENAVLTFSAPPDHGDENANGVYTFFAAASTAEAIAPVKLTVKEYPVKKQSIPANVREYFGRRPEEYSSLYDTVVLEVLEIEESPLGSGKDANREGSFDTPRGLSTTIKVADLIDLVKGDAKKYIPEKNDTEVRRSLDPATGYEEGSVQDRLLKLLSTGSLEDAEAEISRWMQDVDAGKVQLSESDKAFRAGILQRKTVTPQQAAQNRAELDEMISKTGLLSFGEKRHRPVFLPKETVENRKTSSFARTVAEAKQTPDWFVEEVERGVAKGDGGFSYIVATDKAAMKYVDAISKKSFETNLKTWEAMMLTGKGTGVRDMFSKNDIALGEWLYTEAVKMGAAGSKDGVLLATRLVAELASIGTQAGQAVQAMSLLKKMTPSGKLYYLQKTVERLNRDLEKKGVVITIDADLAREVLSAQTREDLDAAMDKLLQDIADQTPVTLMDKWNTWRYLAMLGNPRTHIRNVLSNAVFAPATFLKDLIGIGLENAFIEDPAQRTKAMGWSEYKDFALVDFENVKDQIAGTGKQNPADLIRDRRKIFKAKGLQWINTVSKKNSEWMEAEDVIFLKQHYSRALGQFLAAHNADVATLDNTAAGKNLLKKAREYAILEAQKATFRDASVLASAISRFEQTGGPAAKFVAGSLMPFKKTPINILKRGVEYSPIGLIDTVLRGTVKLKNGDISVNEYIDRISAGLTGTSIMAIGWFLAKLGLLRSTGGDDENEGAFEELQGVQNYSIVIGDMSFTIDWMAPAALPLFIGCEVFNLRNDGKDMTLGDLSDTVMSLASPLFQLSMLDGLNDTLNATKYSDDPSVVAVGQTMVTSYLGQAIPTILGQVARTIDGTRRTSYVDKNKGTLPFNSRFMQTSVLAKTPFASQTLTPKLDAWGRTDTQRNMLLGLMENAILPGYLSWKNISPMETELDRLYKVTGNSSVLPKSMSKYFNVDKVRYDLSADEWETYQTVAGQTSYRMLSDLVNSPAYRSLTDAQKADAVEDIFTYAKEKGKAAAVPSYTDAPSWIGKADDMSKRGFSVDEYVVQRIYSNGTDVGSTQDVLSMSWLSDTDRANLISDSYGKKLTKNTFSDPNRSGYIYSLTEAQVEQYEQYFETQWQAEYVQLTGSTRYLNADIETRAKMIDDLKGTVADGTKKWMARQLRSEGVRSTKKD